MKFSKFENVILFSLILAVATAGCKKRPGFLTPLPGARSGQVAGPDSAGPLGPGVKTGDEGPTSTGIKSNDRDSHQGWNENAELFKADTVHFDFDSSVVKSAEKGKVAKIADYLKS